MKQHFKWGLLAILALAQFMVVLDSSIVNVALPAIQEALSFSPTNLQWVVTAYTLAFGGFLLLGGRAADLYGRRKMFLAGVIGFTISSLLAGISDSSTTMIIARGLQGLSAAFMSPAALSIVLTNFTEGKARNTALGIWAAVAAGGAAAGLLFGGILTEYLDWRWNFFVNLPVGLFVVIMARLIVPAHAKEVAHNDLDLPGAILVTGGLITLVYGLVKAPTWGWTDGTTLSFLAAAVALLVGFVVNEARAKHPLVPLSIFRIRNVSAANLIQMPIIAGMFSMFFFLSLYVQQILHYSPVHTGLSFLPVTVIIAITATMTSQVIAKTGFKPLLIVAPLLMAAGLFFLSHIPVQGAYWTNVFPGLAILAVGAGMSFVSLTIAATSGVPANESGLASGLINTAQQVGGSLGLAILSGIAASATASALVGTQHTELDKAIASVHGFHGAFHVGVGFTIGAAVLAVLLVKNQRRDAAAAGQPAPAMH